MADTKFEVDKDKLEVRISRVFKAPIEKVWQAYTDPELIAQWWRNTTIETHDLRVGGKWRFVDHGKNGDENHAFSGEFKEIEEPNKIVRTFIYEPWPNNILVEAVRFEFLPDGTTQMVTTTKFEKIEHLEAMVQSGMERGAVAGVERIAKLVEG
jgi:uncharacterized protein YndB with AHSA1/START domain